MSFLLRSYASRETFHRGNPWFWTLVEAGIAIGMVIPDTEGLFSGDGCRPPDGYHVCECDPGLPGICFTKFSWRGHAEFYTVTPREIHAALAAYDGWDGELASIMVPMDREWLADPESFEPLEGLPGVVVAPLGESGAADFRLFVSFLRASESEGFRVS